MIGLHHLKRGWLSGFKSRFIKLGCGVDFRKTAQYFETDEVFSLQIWSSISCCFDLLAALSDVDLGARLSKNNLDRLLTCK